MQILLALTAGFAALSLVLFGFAVRAVRRKKWLGSAGTSGSALLLLSLSALGGTLSMSMQGYRALTGEEVAVTVTTVPTGPSAFQAFVEFADGRDTTLTVRGDQIMIDAHILKWHYLGNVIGLRTQYELDRLQGRYVEIENERSRERTVHSLKTDKPVDLFEIVQRYSFLAVMVDTEYGSATYIDVTKPARFQVLVSTTGLLVREIALPAGG